MELPQNVVEMPTLGLFGHEVPYKKYLDKPKKDYNAENYYLAQCSDNKKLEVEMWNLKVKGTDVVSDNQRFQELELMCARMFPEESDKIEKYVDGLPDMIYESVMASKPKTMQDAIEFATELMDKKISTFAERVAIAYTAGPGERKEYAGTLPLCNKWHYQNHENQAEGIEARGMVYALGGGETDQDPNNIEDEIEA
ncbi:hypothetical protein Tco_0829045 [Tanacetum coccineum]